MDKKKVLIVFGTRPEAIKMAPIVKELDNLKEFFDVRVCVTAQHRSMLDQVLNIFNIRPYYDLDIMKPSQNLYELTSNVLLGMQSVLDDYLPNIVLVHGDTTTTSIASLAAFYKKILVGHVEAGLRTFDIQSPWPEEMNRQFTGIISNYHFAPTKLSRKNLISEGKKEDSIVVTGNTVIDSLLYTVKNIENNISLQEELFFSIKLPFDFRVCRFILVTGHRRENFGQGMENICNALKKIAINNPEVEIVYPVHFNPKVQQTVFEVLSDIGNIHLIDPLNYQEFIFLMSHSFIIITDSGGIQEEAPSLGKPVLVTRTTTERPEAIEAGTAMLVGTNTEEIVKEAERLLINKNEYEKISTKHNPYGDGDASKKIVNYIKNISL